MMKLFRNKKAQNVAEYAILIALVVGAIIAIQRFAQLALQARVRDASQYMVDNTNFGLYTNANYASGQYQPYYASSQTTTNKFEEESVYGNANEQGYGLTSSTNASGTQNATYNEGGTISNGMIF